MTPLICPRCGTQNIEETTVGFPKGTPNPNKATCITLTCGWTGIVSDIEFPKPAIHNMNIYLILSRKDDNGNRHTLPDSGWNHDCAQGFIVQANTSHDARELAAEAAGEEGPIVWTSIQHTSCDRLGITITSAMDTKPLQRILMRDFWSA